MAKAAGRALLLVILLVVLVPASAFLHGVGLRPQRSALAARRGVVARRAQHGLCMAAADVTDANFKDLVLDSDVPTLVSFWAPWCGPCRMIKPVLEQIQEEYDGKLQLMQMNTDENQETATEYGIRSIPTLMLFKGGERVDTIIGAVPKATLDSKLAAKL